jgi:Cu(I)/Ag(I) efflux system membrane protein CusA/SilA
MIGGMISSTLLTLIVIPAIFGLVKGFRLHPAGKPQPLAQTKAVVTKLRLPEHAK